MRGVLIVGGLGSGKVERVRKMAGLLPAPEGRDALENAMIYVQARLMDPDGPYVVTAPFRAPHYTVSTDGLVGSWAVNPRTGARVRFRPGEASLANNGCLMLDDLTEFRKSSIEALASVLKAGESDGVPARPALLAATVTPPTDMKRFKAWAERVAIYGEALGLTEIVTVNANWQERAA